MQDTELLAEALAKLSPQEASDALNWLFGYLRLDIEADHDLYEAWDKAIEGVF